MGLFDKLFGKKEVEKSNSEENTPCNANNTISKNSNLENMLSEDDCYSNDKTLKILETLQKSELFQFIDNPVEGEQATSKMLTYTQQINNQSRKLVAVFTNHMAMQSIMKEKAFFCASSVNIFDSISAKVIRDENLDGIVVNPQQQNYIITKNTLINWNNYKLKLQNAQLLELIEEKISYSEINITDNYNEVLKLLEKALLPMPIKKDSNGKELIHINMNKSSDGKIWLCLFTNSNDLTNYMKEKTEIRYMPQVLQNFALDVMKSDYSGIVVNITGKQFIIPSGVCNTIALSNKLYNEQWLKKIEEKIASPDSELSGNYFDIIIMLQKAYLPFPIVKMSDGNENLFVSLVTLQNEEKWIYIFTNTDEITRDMQNNNLEVVSIQNNNRMLDRIMKNVVNNNLKGIVVNPYSRQFKIPFETCKMITESNKK